MENAASTNRWSALLDRLVAREHAPGESEPPFIDSLGVPYPDTWRSAAG